MQILYDLKFSQFLNSLFESLSFRQPIWLLKNFTTSSRMFLHRKGLKTLVATVNVSKGAFMDSQQHTKNCPKTYRQTLFSKAFSANHFSKFISIMK